MLLKLKRDALLKPLLLTTGFVEKKQVMPILSNVYIKRVGNDTTLIANDMEIQISVTTHGEMSGDDFTITLPAKKLQDVLKTFSDDVEIKMELVDNKVNIKSGRSKFTLQSLSADHYPLLQIKDEVTSQFSISQLVLKNLLGQTQYAMADKDSRVFLNGMLFEVKNNQLILVATDAHRLGFSTCPLSAAIPDTSAIIPRKTVLELYRLLDYVEDTVTIKMYPHQVSFETTNKQLFTKVIDGKYPDYERVIPLHNDKLATVNREELLKAVERVSVIGVDNLKTITVGVTPDSLQLMCRNEDQEESIDEVAINYQHTDTMTFNFNIAYLKDLLTIAPAPTLQLAFFDGQRSILATIPNEIDFKAVLMPLRN